MKPTEQQIKTLEKYLKETLTYRETYEEIYDHILTALEHQPGNISYQDAVNNVINNDFGEPKNLLKIEKLSKQAMVKESINKYLAFFVAYFKFPGLLYTGAGSLLTYYFFSQVNFGVAVFETLLIIVTIVAPGAIMMLRLFTNGYLLNTTRKSAKDKMFENFAGGPVRLLVVLHIWVFKVSANGYYLPGFKDWFNTHTYTVTAILVTCTIYSMALYKLYKAEFKTVVV